MNKKTIIIVLTGVLLIFAVFTFTLHPLWKLSIYCQEAYNWIPFYFAQFGIYVFIGILLGFFDRTIHYFKKTGTWKINICKLLIFGIPFAVYGSVFLIDRIINIPLINKIFVLFTYYGAEPVVVSQTILGYIIITSFYKE